MSSISNSFSGSMNSYVEGKAQESVLKRNAYMAIEESQMAQTASRKRTAQLTSQQRALYAKAGVDISSGSPLLIMSDTAAQGKLEEERIKWSGMEQYKMGRYYARLAKTAGNASSTTQALAGTLETIKTIASAVAGGAAGGGAGGAISGAMSGGGSVSGEQWGKFISSFSNQSNYGLGKAKSPYSGRYY